MSRTRRAAGGPRLAPIVLGLIAALAVAACGSSATTTPSSGPDGSVAPGDTTGPGDSQAPGETTGSGDASDAFAAATTALDALDSYAFNVEIESTTSANGTTTASHMVLSGVVVNSPTEASSLQQQELDADGNVTTETGIIVIGSDAWVQSGADTPWTAIPASSAAAFIQAMAGFRPEQMFGLYFSGLGGNFTAVGSETKNGIDSTHYQGDAEVGTMLGQIAGFDGNWSSDVWIANDGGHLVHSEAGAESATGADAGSYGIVVDITDPNSAGPIEPPA